MSINERKGFVYLIREEGTNNYKIGHTKNMDQRWKQINSPKPPRPYDLIRKIYCSDRYEAKSALNRQFAAFRGNGEWFDFSESMITGAVSDAYDDWNEEQEQTYEKPVYSSGYPSSYSSGYSGGYSDDSNLLWFLLIGAVCAVGALYIFVAGRSTNYVFCKSSPGCTSIYVRDSQGNKILTIGNQTPVTVIGKPDKAGYVQVSVTTSKGESVAGYVHAMNLISQPPDDRR